MSNSKIAQLAIKEIDRYGNAFLDLLRTVDEDALWIKYGKIPNSIGTLARHLTGNINHFLGGGILKNGYKRDREKEFSETGIAKLRVISDLQNALAVAREALMPLDAARLAQPYRDPDGMEYESLAYHLFRLVTHFVYHCGQAAYAKKFVG